MPKFSDIGQRGGGRLFGTESIVCSERYLASAIWGDIDTVRVSGKVNCHNEVIARARSIRHGNIGVVGKAVSCVDLVSIAEANYRSQIGIGGRRCYWRQADDDIRV